MSPLRNLLFHFSCLVQLTDFPSYSLKHDQQAVWTAGELREKVQLPRLLLLPPVLRHSFNRALYKFGRTLGAGTYGIVREAESQDGQKVAVKIILKKNVKGNERMVYDELEMLQALKHPHIVSFVDWFESKVSSLDRSSLRVTNGLTYLRINSTL